MQIEILKIIQSIANPFFDVFFQFITMLAEPTTLLLFLSIILWCINKEYGYKLGFIILFSNTVNGLIKGFVNAKRPIGEKGIRSLRISTATGSSFPSGHTQNMSTFAFQFMYFFRKTWIIITGSILILMVACSRLYLGVHWPIDVLCGIVFGILSVLLADIIFEADKTHKGFLFFLILVIIMFLFVNQTKDFIIAVALISSLCLGYKIDKQYICFSTKATPIKQVLKVVIGLAITGLIYFFFKKYFPQNNMMIFISHFIIGLWICCIYPALFKPLKLC